LARNLLAAKQPVRAVLRDARKAGPWAQAGCEVAVADIADAAAMAAAFRGTEAVFVLVPPLFDPSPGFPEAQTIAATLKLALEEGAPGSVVYLSTIGAQATRTNLLSQHTIIEQKLRDQMLDGFNEGWIDFEFDESARRKETVALKTVLKGLIDRQTAG